MLEHALERSSGRLDKAARLLRISRKNLHLKRQRYGLDDASDRTGSGEPADEHFLVDPASPHTSKVFGAS